MVDKALVFRKIASLSEYQKRHNNVAFHDETVQQNLPG